MYISITREIIFELASNDRSGSRPPPLAQEALGGSESPGYAPKGRICRSPPPLQTIFIPCLVL